MIFKKISFDGGKHFYIAPNWNQLGHLSFKLAKQILTDENSYDKIIVIAKGGLTWSRVLADYLQISDVDTIRVKLYRGIGKTFKKPQIILPVKTSISGERILLFDDVADSGQTLEFVEELLKKQGAKSVTTAALFYKSSSKITPDYYDHQTNAWIVFPHEIREFVEETARDWLQKGLSKKQILARFDRLDLPKDQTKYFLDKMIIK